MLKDARGYRSPYINALNGAVAAARVVGGDVVPEETPSGTLLTIAKTRRAGRFELFCGYDNGGESGADAFCLSDGTLYVAAVAQELKPGRDVFRRDGELQPRASGWCTRKTITDGQTLTFACVRYAGEYYLIARKDGESASALLPEALGTIDPEKLEELFTFGQFYFAGSTGDKSIRIRQDVRGDVWYGGEGGAAPAEEKLLPLTIRQFAVTTETSSGATTTNKVGLYIPNAFSAQLYAVDKGSTTSSGIAWATKWLLVDGYDSVDAEHQLWRDITNSVSSAGEATVYIIADIQVNGDACELTIALRDTAETIADAYGWAIPLATIQRANGNFAINQFRFGPLLESKHLIGCRLVKTTKTPYTTGFDPLADWATVADGEALSATYKYFFEGQTHLRLSFAESAGGRETALTTRHQENWLENTIHIQVKPLVFANFGSIIS